MEKNLKLKFKGERKYLHGSDFFNTLNQLSLELLGEMGFVEKLTFKSFATHACILTDCQPESANSLVAQARIKSNASDFSKDFWILETSDLVKERYAFDEDALVASAKINTEAKSITLIGRSVYTPIEEIIALTKSLNYKLSPSVSGKWVFGQLDLLKPLYDDYKVLRIDMKNLIKDRFSVNDIMLDNEHFGTIRFIVGSPA